MPVNPVGYVPIYDGGTPKIVTGRAKAVLSGGELAFASGADDTVSSGANSFADGDVQFSNGASGGQFNGIVLENVESGALCSVASEVTAISRASATVTAGFPVSCDGVEAVENTGSLTMTATSQYHKIGRALTSATSGNFALVQYRA